MMKIHILSRNIYTEVQNRIKREAVVFSKIEYKMEVSSGMGREKGLERSWEVHGYHPRLSFHFG
jgi:hypothetical protein